MIESLNWPELEAAPDPDTAWIQQWLDELNWDVRKQADQLLAICPPRFDDWQRWAVEFRACVQFALGLRLDLSLDRHYRQQIARLKWSRSKGGRTGRCGSCVQRRIR